VAVAAVATLKTAEAAAVAEAVGNLLNKISYI
jgi:hypothetical protein